MPVAVHCPNCGKELIAPNELIGKLAACPQCNTHFPVAGDNGRDGQVASPPAAPPSNPPASNPPAPTRAPQSLAPPPPPQPVQQRMPPTEMPKPKPADPPAARMPDKESFFPPTKSPRASSPAPQKPSPANLLPTKKTTPAKAPAPKTASPQRAAQPARFIASQATDTAIELGQDGQLPTLVLQEGKAKEEVEDDSQRTNPLLLAAVLGFALISSIALLLIDPQVQRSERADKQQARELIQRHYIKDQAHILPEPYQRELRKALQAYNSEDYATERKHYRNVVRLLHAENNNELKGLTGQVRADQHPNDEDLKELLDTLLRKD